MGMAVARRGGAVSEINVTPMIDVLLVLLIIFMVVQQGLQRGLSVNVPPPPADTPAPPTPDQIVLEVFPGGRYAINTQPVGAEGLQAAVARTFAGRPRKVLFIKGGEGLTYGQVAAAVDATRAAGVEIVGLVPRPES
jgi:biopolymer transport protein ExbD/biopolymer transport protein TolR